MDRLYTTEELAERLRLSEGTVRNWRAKGEGVPAVKIGGAVRYRESDIEEYLSSMSEEEDDTV